jgi:hypothetical protein
MGMLLQQRNGKCYNASRRSSAGPQYLPGQRPIGFVGRHVARPVSADRARVDGQYAQKAKIAGNAGCEHNRDAVRADP